MLDSNHNELRKRFILLSELLLKSFSHINTLEQPRALDKVAFRLFHLVDEPKAKLFDNPKKQTLSVTQQELADSLGLTRETTGAELKKLEVKKIIQRSRSKYVLFMERLRSYIDDRS